MAYSSKSYFPSQTVSDAEKISYDYGLKVGKAIEHEWFNNDRNLSRYRSNQNDFHNLRLYFNSIREDAIEVGLKVNDIENYFPRSWNREAIEANEKVFKQLLVDEGIVPEKEVDDVVKGMLNKQNELYSSHSNLLTQARKFQDLDDNKFKEFLTNDLHSVTTDYFMNAARTIEHKKHFLSKGQKTKIYYYIKRIM